MSRKAICGIRCKNRSLSIKKYYSVLTIILLIAFSMPAFAEVGPDGHSISPFVSGYSFDGNRDQEHRPVYSLRPGYDYTKNWGVEAAAPVLPTTNPAAPTPEAQKPVLSWETGAGKSYFIPALEIIGFDFLLNRFDYYFIDKEVYGTTSSTIRDNLTGTWIIDNDPFSTNQFLHPYQGSMYYGFARSAGLNFWESLGYAVAGSFLWEIAGETGPPSINDQITTPLGGSFLGEPLFRMASLLLEDGGGKPGFWRELGAAVISPPTGFNRLAFGNRFNAVFPSRDPAISTRFQLGASLITNVSNQGTSSSVQQNEATADFSIAYGLPGKPGYLYTRPFDYFSFQFTASTANIFENIITRGLLFGTKYAVGDSYRGIWGLYGSYDYIAPQIFRISSTALSLGTTAQWWLSRTVALQGTVLGGIGYGAAGTIQGTGERDYHYGATPQGLLELRLILGNRAMLNLTGQEYYVSGVGSTESRGSENIARVTASFTLRMFGRHGIGIKYVASQRDAHYPDIQDRHQTVGTISVAYTYLGETEFGAVEWRDTDATGR
jgi:hypothetical protein